MSEEEQLILRVLLLVTLNAFAFGVFIGYCVWGRPLRKLKERLEWAEMQLRAKTI